MKDETLLILIWFQVLFSCKSSGNHLELVLNGLIYRFQVTWNLSRRNQLDSSRKEKEKPRFRPIHPSIRPIWAQKMQGKFIQPRMEEHMKHQLWAQRPLHPSIRPVWRGVWIRCDFFSLIFVSLSLALYTAIYIWEGRDEGGRPRVLLTHISLFSLLEQQYKRIRVSTKHSRFDFPGCNHDL